MENISVIKLKGKEYKIHSSIIEKLLKEDVALSDDYFEYINSYRNPYSSQLADNDISMLLICDYWNRIVYSEERGLGRIVVYYKDDKKIYDNLVDAILENYESKFICGFTSFDSKGIVPIKETIHFFGLDILVTNSHPYLKTLNKIVRDIYTWKNGKQSLFGFNDAYFKKNWVL